MYVDPRHRRHLGPPPPEWGHRLATFARGEDAELRLNLIDRSDHQTVSLHIWRRSHDGNLWPASGPGATLKPHEIPAAIAALQEAQRILELAHHHDDAPPVRGFDGRAGESVPYGHQSGAPKPATSPTTQPTSTTSDLS